MRFALPVFVALTLALALASSSGCGKTGLPGGDDMAGVGGGSGGGGGGTGGSGGGGGTGGSGGGGARDCTASCNRCQNGPCCGNACCNAGEWCDTTTNTCKCGDGAACTNGDFCARGGPIGPGSSVCGSICCGGPGGGPCPL